MMPPNAMLERPMPNQSPIADELIQRVSRETLVRRDEPLAKHTTLRVGGPADLYIEPASEEDLARALNFCAFTVSFFFNSPAPRILTPSNNFFSNPCST